MTDLTVVDAQHHDVSPGAITQGVFAQSPKHKIDFASEVASLLVDVIRKQGLSKKLGTNEHVLVEGWATMGAMIGILPKERDVRKHQDGTYEAYVDLIRIADGVVVGGASAICPVDWNRDPNARRSMAITRATGKAYRLGYSWIMALAGYNVTPLEEMELSSKERTEPPATVYQGLPEQKTEVMTACKSSGLDTADHWKRVGEMMSYKTMDQLGFVVKEYVELQKKGKKNG